MSLFVGHADNDLRNFRQEKEEERRKMYSGSGDFFSGSHQSALLPKEAKKELTAINGINKRRKSLLSLMSRMRKKK